MELEELKKGWKEMDEQLDKLEPKNEVPISHITRKRTVSSQQRLKREYRMMTAICLLVPFWVAIA